MDATIKARLSTMVGKKTAKGCPDCGAMMVVRQNRRDDNFFLGCNRYPDCRNTMEIDEAMYMELIGQKRMFA
jgi:ssDNA-binding Zn-finger/Zn-ribbon topoisomerase 1